MMEESVTSLLARVASVDPTPGGGSVSALAGAQGAALCAMVWRLTGTKSIDPEAEKRLADAAARLDELRSRLLLAFEADSASYEAVMAAFRLPRETDAHKAARREAIEEATKHATLVPLETARDCFEVLEACAAAVTEGHQGAVTDAGVGLQMAHAGLQGALYNVEINLGSLKDEGFKESTTAEVARLRAAGETVYQRIEATMRRVLAS
ncbi:MAG: cyclodeaminase/cyclohydrolase family protein [Actinobacteria bacterium]|nr:cyclodeaminase/cyclohydrolase family protein [Actinomycetota bacterium]